MVVDNLGNVAIGSLSSSYYKLYVANGDVSFANNLYVTGNTSTQNLQANSSVVKQQSTAVAHLWIESPLDASAVSKLFSTHPPIEERIATLRAMEREY